MMISKDQIRAGMAFLQMSGKDLAQEIGMSANALNTFLRSSQTGTSTRRYEQIINVLADRGIEFLPDNGVRLRGK